VSISSAPDRFGAERRGRLRPPGVPLPAHRGGGVGFRVADRVARSLGVELDAPQRLRAGLLFALEEAESEGNVFLPLEELWRAAGRLLEVHDVEPLEAALRRLVRDGELVLEGERAYRAELWQMERRLAALLARRVRTAPGELFPAPRRPSLDVSDEQWSVVELVRTRPLVLLTGLPGAGKTHTQRVLVEVARRTRVRVLLCAPTGKAARRMLDITGHEAMTIHRALGFSPLEGRFLRDEDHPLSDDVELVIVDEASMSRSSWPMRSSAPPATATSCSSETPTSSRRSGPAACSPTSSPPGSCGAST
jgi:exodeoxyribonuclease V alpha subunit